jgi:hypothetical protein
MRIRSWLALCLWACMLGAATGPIAAGESAAETGGDSSGTPRRELGVLAAVRAEAHVVVPEDGLWRAPQGDFICADSISVSPESGPPLIRRARAPRPGQFSYQPDGAIVFAAADVGREFTVRYQFRPRRVVLLDAATPTDYPDAPAVVGQALAEELGKRGFVVVSAQEVKGAAARLALEAITPHALPAPERLAALAQQTNAAYVLIPGVAVKQDSKPGEFDTGIPIPQDEREKRSRSVFVEEPTLILPTTHYRLYGAARLAIADGATGAVVSDVSTSSSQRVRAYRFSPARRSLMRRLAAQVVAAWRQPAGSAAPR